MARKSGKKMVVKSTKKVVEESVQVSVISSNKRLTRRNKDAEAEEQEKEQVLRVIPVHEAKGDDSTSGTTTISGENKNNDQEEQNRNINIIREEMKKSKTEKLINLHHDA
ncbi:hypothetical protein RYX36_036901 [Vicia faba]